MSDRVEAFMAKVMAKNPAQAPFHQAVREVVETVLPVIDANPAYGRMLSR